MVPEVNVLAIGIVSPIDACTPFLLGNGTCPHLVAEKYLLLEKIWSIQLAELPLVV